MKNFQLSTAHLEKLDKRFYDICRATPLENPFVVSLNKPLLNELGFNLDDLESEEFIGFLNGHYIPSGSIPHANAYSGHQFGYFVPNLGDGRALNLGMSKGHHLQLKGSGITKYSREGDGRAVLRSSIREYLISEAMHALGIPTTRALALIGSDTKVYRQTGESGAILLRSSSSWVRFGSFEFAYLGDKKQERVKNLADFVIEESYSHLKDHPHKYEELYFAVSDRTIELIALWQSVGFMHGVMNTDNMSIAGLTIDYGPYAFMENFQKDFVCNASDYDGRYSFEAQPYIAQWNLSALAKALSPIADEDLLNRYNDTFIGKFKKRYFELMGKKLGLLDYNFDTDKTLITNLLNALEEDKIDYTPFFYNLSNNDTIDMHGSSISLWLKEYYERIKNSSYSKEDIQKCMKETNPKYVLKNYMLQEAIAKAELNDFTLVDDLLKIAQNPFGEHKEYEHYSKPSKPNNTFICSCSS
ncbi:YdiU family protein [Sulfurimonas sp.]|uniref:protein adenylyltransferase SelO n=1 Tax=Sulfurimonas sp. TaxID=2022749 RepID=UPI0035614386